MSRRTYWVLESVANPEATIRVPPEYLRLVLDREKHYEVEYEKVGNIKLATQFSRPEDARQLIHPRSRFIPMEHVEE